MARPDYVPADAEDITNHGAVTNPTDPSDGSYSTNRSAIISAADAAGSEGAIYVPEGTYYFGEDDQNAWIVFGSHTTATGISVYGDGPEKSTLAMTEHVPETAIATLLRYDNDVYDTTATTVEYRGIKIDGNQRNLGDHYSNNVGSIGIRTESGNSEMTIRLEEAWVYDTYNAGVRHYEGNLEAYYSTFERCGLGVERDSPSGNDASIDHCIVPIPNADKTATIERCEFLNTPGNAVDAGGNGSIETYWSWGSGLGTGWYKLQDCDTYIIENTYMEPNTTELENLVSDPSYEDGFVGRRSPFYIISGDDSVLPFVRTDHIKVVSTTHQPVSLYDHNSRTTPNVEWHGDMIAFHDTTKIDTRDEVVNSSDTLDFESVDIGRLSAHDCHTTDIFNITGDGTIDQVNHNNSGSLGSTGNITVNTNNSGGAAFEPDVPVQSEVGYDGKSGDGGDTGGDTTYDAEGSLQTVTTSYSDSAAPGVVATSSGVVQTIDGSGQ